MEMLSFGDSFTFSCGPERACFNQCCRDLNQYLTPYDILRLRAHFGLTSGEFLQRYTREHIGPETGLPIITLKTDPSVDLVCPFVSPKGCRVYQNRPSSCRMYPLARALTRDRSSGKLTEYYMLLCEDHCKGFQGTKSQTVGQWLDQEGLRTCNKLNDMMMEIISLKNQKLPGPLDLKSRRMFFVACYDLDRFREMVYCENLLRPEEFDPVLFKAAQNDDVALLKLGLIWVRRILFQ